MIGEFKNANKPSVGNTYTTLYTAPADGAYLIQLDVANADTVGVQVSVRIYDTSAVLACHLVKDVPVPQGSTLSILSGQKVVLESGDYIEARCETTSKTVDIICSLVANVNG